MNLYHLSPVNHDGKTFYPRIPKTAATGEDLLTPRVCFAPTIRQAIVAINPAGDFMSEYEYFVHIPVNCNNVYIPTELEVPDVDDTEEIWIKEPVKLACIGKVIVRYGMSSSDFEVIDSAVNKFGN